MKRIQVVSVLASIGFLLAGCSGGGSNGSSTVAANQLKESYDVKGVEFALSQVPGGTFGMGTRASKALITGASSPHQVVMDGYAIMPQPVNQALWQAVMGSNPSSVKGDDLPVDLVSYKDCEKFAAKLSKLTGLPFMLPTEAMWEFAQKQGILVPDKALREWCSDLYSDSAPAEISVNYAGAESGNQRTVRTVTERAPLADYTKASSLGFRLAVPTDAKCPQEVIAAVIDLSPEREHVSSNESFDVKGVKFNMIGVSGGSFTMGATPEQADYAGDDEKPALEATVEDFEIGQTEVTAALWQAVMGTLPVGNYTNRLNRPVINVSWYAAQEFILELNKLTGRKFRLPTEAEWEYAARGGKRSGHYRYAGSNDVNVVAAYTKTTDGKPVDVKKFRANELGIYDMSGNAWEWCQDVFGEYGKTPVASEWHVMRGGSAASPWDACRVSNRSNIPASNTKGTFGFRLAL